MGGRGGKIGRSGREGGAGAGAGEEGEAFDCFLKYFNNFICMFNFVYKNLNFQMVIQGRNSA